MATRAERVLEAQYQEAVRQRIDDVYDAFVLGTLAARQTLRYARQSVQGLEKLATKTEELYRGQSISLGDYNRIKIQLRTARLGLIDAEAAYRKAKLDLGSLMNLSREEIARPGDQGIDRRQGPARRPTSRSFGRIALAERPDVISFRLGVLRAEADVRLARANRLNDVYRPVPAVHLPGQHALRPEERHVLGAGSHGSPADLQSQPGGDPAGRAECRPDQDRAGRRSNGRS